MNAEQFLQSIHFMPTAEELAQGGSDFRHAMHLGLLGQDGGLPMLPAYLPMKSACHAGEALVLDAGGTNLRTAHVRMTSSGMEILEKRERPMPGTKGRLGATEFFRQLAQDAAEMMTSAMPIGFCFSFTADILPDGDARVIYLDKELCVDGLVGRTVAQGLRDALKDLGAPAPTVIRVMNDAVAALLGASVGASDVDGCIGMILGTGFNCCYAEQNSRITKAPTLSEQTGRSIVNIEAGAFAGMASTPADLLVRSRSIDPDQNLLEKMLSGAYQGPLLGALLELAAEQDCFRQAPDLSHLSPTAADISAMVNGKHSPLEDAFAKEDVPVLHTFCHAIIQRASALAAMVLKAIVAETGDVHAPILLSIEGSTYWKNPLLQSLLADVLKDIPLQLVRTNEANLLGAAAAVMGA